jgi:membrane dipeptidase
MILRRALVSALAVVLCGCGTDGSAPQEDLESQAKRLAQELILVDTHVDVPYRLNEKVEDISQRTEGGDFDYPRAVAGGLNAPFMSIYVPSKLQESGGAREHADRLIDMVEQFELDWPDKFGVARSPLEVRARFAEGRIALPMGIENGAPITDREALQHFFDRGVRYITLTHATNNHICDSSYAEERDWDGLSPFGRQLVEEMNRVGMMIDITHVSDATFTQVIELSRAPVIASHSSCRHYTPDFERNMDDDMIRRLAENGGVIGINFGSAFLTEESNRQSMARWMAIRQYMEEHGLEQESEEVEAFSDEYRREHPPILADVSDVADHIDHVIQLVGVDHVGIGSDFDGVGPSTPTGLKDVSFYPNLIRVLLERGYSQEDLSKICGENFLRVWSEVERIAGELQAAG